MDKKDMMERLRKPFPMKDIEWRAQRFFEVNGEGRVVVVPYIDARAVMNRLDEVFGLDGWKDEYERWGEAGVKCRLHFRVGDEWHYREDAADEPKTVPTKGGISVAFKRAAVKLGIGRYLYDLDEYIVPLNSKQQYKNDVYFRDAKTGKKGWWSIPDLPDTEWARIPEERGKSNVARGDVAQGKDSPSRATQQSSGSTSKEGKITAKTLSALKKELDASFGEEAMTRITPFLRERFNKESINDLTQDEGVSLLQSLEAARKKKEAKTAATRVAS